MPERVRSNRRKRAVLEIALECFSRHGYEATTTRTIQTAAGISVGSFYHHFGSKAGLAAELFIEGLHDKNQVVLADLATASGPEEGVRAVVEAHVRWIADNPDWARFLYEHRGAVPEGSAQARLTEVNKAFSAALMSYFRPYLEDGSIRDLPSECYSVIMLGPVQEYARRWLGGRTESHPGALTKVFSDAAWDALRGR